MASIRRSRIFALVFAAALLGTFAPAHPQAAASPDRRFVAALWVAASDTLLKLSAQGSVLLQIPQTRL